MNIIHIFEWFPYQAGCIVRLEKCTPHRHHCYECKTSFGVTVGTVFHHTRHQWLTGEMGHPKLREHLIGVMAIMRAALNWNGFRRALARAYPKRFEDRSPVLGDNG